MHLLKSQLNYIFFYRPAKDRLRGYFRLSSKRTKKEQAKHDDQHHNSGHSDHNRQQKKHEDADKVIKDKIVATAEHKSSVDKSGERCDDGVRGGASSGGRGVNNESIKIKNNARKFDSIDKGQRNRDTLKNINNSDGHENVVRDRGHSNSDVKTISSFRNKLKQKKVIDTKYEKTPAALAHDRIVKSFFENTSALDPLTNSYTSTPYNGLERDLDTDTASSLYTDRDSVYEKKPLCEKSDSYYRTKPIMKTNLYKTLDNSSSILGSEFSRNGSTSTLERDLEIIDLLERERSVDIQEMIANERRAEYIASANVSRQSSTVERRRKLPDIEYAKNVNTKLMNLKEAIAHQAGNRYSPTIGMRDCSFEDTTVHLSRKSSRSSYGNRESFPGIMQVAHELEGAVPVVDHRILDHQHRLSRQRSNNSSRGSIGSRRFSGNEFREGFSDDL